MDLRQTERYVWGVIWTYLGEEKWHTWQDEILNRAVDDKLMTSTAKEKRMAKAIEIVREKIFDKSYGYAKTDLQKEFARLRAGDGQ